MVGSRLPCTSCEASSTLRPRAATAPPPSTGDSRRAGAEISVPLYFSAHPLVAGSLFTGAGL